MIKELVLIILAVLLIGIPVAYLVWSILRAGARADALADKIFRQWLENHK
jgi:hypothetical protein